MSETLMKWLFERKAIFALICIISLATLRFFDHLSDTTFGLCFTAVVTGFLTASVLGDKFGINQP